jgi:hypothetical protein
MKTARKPGAWTFFWQWLKNPLRTAAVAPSSAELAAAMVAELPDDVRRVIELGGGTGAITVALLDAGIHADDLLVLELSEELHAHLPCASPVGWCSAMRDRCRHWQRPTWLPGRPTPSCRARAVSMPPPAARHPRGGFGACGRAGCSCSSPMVGGAGRRWSPRVGLKVRRGDFVLRNCRRRRCTSTPVDRSSACCGMKFGIGAIFEPGSRRACWRFSPGAIVCRRQ